MICWFKTYLIRIIFFFVYPTSTKCILFYSVTRSIDVASEKKCIVTRLWRDFHVINLLLTAVKQKLTNELIKWSRFIVLYRFNWVNCYPCSEEHLYQKKIPPPPFYFHTIKNSLQSRYIWQTIRLRRCLVERFQLLSLVT